MAHPGSMQKIGDTPRQGAARGDTVQFIRQRHTKFTQAWYGNNRLLHHVGKVGRLGLHGHGMHPFSLERFLEATDFAWIRAAERLLSLRRLFGVGDTDGHGGSADAGGLFDALRPGCFGSQAAKRADQAA